MNLLFLFSLTLAAFGLVVVGMAIGVLMGRRAIRGSCGGVGNSAESAAGVSCSLCSDPDAACRELGARGKNSQAAAPVGASPNPSVGMPACEKDCVEEGCSKEAIDACNRS